MSAQSRFGRFDREERRRRRAERRRRRREDAEDAAEAGGEIVGGASDLADLASGDAPTRSLGSGLGGGRGGGRCDGCDGFGRGGTGGRGGGGDGCDACDCNLSLLRLAALVLLVPPRRDTRPRGPGGPRLSTLLLAGAVVLPDAATGPVTAALRLYRRRLTRFTPACPGTPSCSAYAQDAVARLGARRGLRAAARRVRACGADAGHPGPAAPGDRDARSTSATASTSTS
jgi:putative component of membrane protein insertase Oxa1/YidC/SpoIIIJ protein YidD